MVQGDYLHVKKSIAVRNFVNMTSKNISYDKYFQKFLCETTAWIH